MTTVNDQLKATFSAMQANLEAVFTEYERTRYVPDTCAIQTQLDTMKSIVACLKAAEPQVNLAEIDDILTKLTKKYDTYKPTFVNREKSRKDLVKIEETINQLQLFRDSYTEQIANHKNMSFDEYKFWSENNNDSRYSSAITNILTELFIMKLKLVNKAELKQGKSYYIRTTQNNRFNITIDGDKIKYSTKLNSAIYPTTTTDYIITIDRVEHIIMSAHEVIDIEPPKPVIEEKAVEPPTDWVDVLPTDKLATPLPEQVKIISKDELVEGLLQGKIAKVGPIFNSTVFCKDTVYYLELPEKGQYTQCKYKTDTYSLTTICYVFYTPTEEYVVCADIINKNLIQYNTASNSFTSYVNRSLYKQCE
jgi:hypothetical protein